MVQAKQDCSARERAVLNNIKMDSCHAAAPHIKTESMCHNVCMFVWVFACIFDGSAYACHASVEIRVSQCVCVSVCMFLWACAVRDVWSCLLGGVTHTDTSRLIPT